jgi:hypothetical protein
MIHMEYPEWQEPYLKAMLEPLDSQAQVRQVQAAESAIVSRLEELRASSDGVVERRAIHDALETLVFLKTEKRKLGDREEAAEPEAPRRTYLRPSFSKRPN